MSYEPDFTNDAKASWRKLDLALQEEVLDAVDRIANDPGLLRRSRASPEWVFDFTCDVNGIRHYFFLTIRLNRTNQKLIVLKVGHSERKL
jgi:hypothetical protein